MVASSDWLPCVWEWGGNRHFHGARAAAGYMRGLQRLTGLRCVAAVIMGGHGLCILESRCQGSNGWVGGSLRSLADLRGLVLGVQGSEQQHLG